jgi:methionyl-tRNA synthetase
MDNLKNFYVTTAIHYANAKPHIGHAFENLLGDVLFRYNRDLLGNNSYFLTGTDEHGQKIKEKALEKGFDNAQEFVDENVGFFKEMNNELMVEPSQFIRTTSEYHKKGAQEFWQKLEEKGDIYKDEYKGLYCVGCEAFYAEKDLSDGLVCPIHLKKVEEVEEENYFFKLSKYSDEIKSLIESDTIRVRPDSRKKEILSVLEEGLRDVSFSRNKKKMDWGVPVPGDEDHVMYVWCDALTNYVTALGYGENGSPDGNLMTDFWPVDKHIIGKDILRFHAGIWIGMLLSAELPLPLEICVHGFITSEGHKMSKSLGNVVDPMEIAEKYGEEVLRFFLVREIPTGSDGDFSMERFKVVYESDLQNNFGNLLSRSVSMVNKYLDGEVDFGLIEDGDKFEFIGDYTDCYESYVDGMMNFEMKKSFEGVLKFLSKLNQYIEDTQPWGLNKEGKVEELGVVMANLIYGISLAVRMLYPVIPGKAGVAFEVLGLKLDDNVLSFNFVSEKGLSGKHKVAEKVSPLFPRIEWEVEEEA